MSLVNNYSFPDNYNLMYWCESEEASPNDAIIMNALAVVLDNLKLNGYDSATQEIAKRKWKLVGYDEVNKKLADRTFICLDDGSNSKPFFGYDKTISCWHTNEKDIKKFNKWIGSLKSIKLTDYARIKIPYSIHLGKTSQDLLITALKDLRYVPPFFVLQEKNPEGFIQLPVTASSLQAKNVSGVSMDFNLRSFFTDLLVKNKGVFFGHNHNSIGDGLEDLLVDQMKNFYDQGVRFLFVEHSASQQLVDFERFNSFEDEDGKLLSGILNGKQAAQYVSRPFDFCQGEMEIFKTARQCGIKVLPVDVRTAGSRQHLEERMRVGNGGMIRNIDYFLENDANAKYLVLAGGAHHEIAKELGIPNIYFAENLQAIQSVVGETPLKHKIGSLISFNFSASLQGQMTQEEWDNIFIAPDFFVCFNQKVGKEIFSQSEVREYLEGSSYKNVLPITGNVFNALPCPEVMTKVCAIL